MDGSSMLHGDDGLEGWNITESFWDFSSCFTSCFRSGPWSIGEYTKSMRAVGTRNEPASRGICLVVFACPGVLRCSVTSWLQAEGDNVPYGTRQQWPNRPRASWEYAVLSPRCLNSMQLPPQYCSRYNNTRLGLSEIFIAVLWQLSPR